MSDDSTIRALRNQRSHSSSNGAGSPTAIQPAVAVHGHDDHLHCAGSLRARHSTTRRPSQRSRASNNLKQIGSGPPQLP